MGAGGLSAGLEAMGPRARAERGGRWKKVGLLGFFEGLQKKTRR